MIFCNDNKSCSDQCVCVCVQNKLILVFLSCLLCLAAKRKVGRAFSI